MTITAYEVTTILLSSLIPAILAIKLGKELYK